jgi:hypothetical protein
MATKREMQRNGYKRKRKPKSRLKILKKKKSFIPIKRLANIYEEIECGY